MFDVYGKIKSEFMRKGWIIMGTLGFVLGTRAMDHEQVMIDQLADQMKKASAEDRFSTWFLTILNLKRK